MIPQNLKDTEKFYSYKDITEKIFFSAKDLYYKNIVATQQERITNLHSPKRFVQAGS